MMRVRSPSIVLLSICACQCTPRVWQRGRNIDNNAQQKWESDPTVISSCPLTCSGSWNLCLNPSSQRPVGNRQPALTPVLPTQPSSETPLDTTKGFLMELYFLLPAQPSELSETPFLHFKGFPFLFPPGSSWGYHHASSFLATTDPACFASCFPEKTWKPQKTHCDFFSTTARRPLQPTTSEAEPDPNLQRSASHLPMLHQVHLALPSYQRCTHTSCIFHVSLHWFLCLPQSINILKCSSSWLIPFWIFLSIELP